MSVNKGTISVAIMSRNRLMELATVLGVFSQNIQLLEVVVLDNSDKPYLDNPIFVLLQEVYSRSGKDLIFVRRSERLPVTIGKALSVQHCSGEYVLVWDDDSIPMTPIGYDLIDRLDGYSLLSWCFLDAINYLGYSDWVDWCNPDTMGEIIHPATVQYRWFCSVKYDRIETPWGGNGIFFVQRERWLDFYERSGRNIVCGFDVRAAPIEVLHNAAYCTWNDNKPAAIYFQDRLINMYHPSQGREWDLESFDRVMEKTKDDFMMEEGVARFVGYDEKDKSVRFEKEIG